MNRSAAVFGVLLVAILLAGVANAQQDRVQQMWWNESLIVDDLGLSKAQRKQMDAAYQRYGSKIEVRRRTAVTQGPYLEALEAGDWETAKQASDEWLVALRAPMAEMVALKLAVLPILTAEQRVILVEKHQRVVRGNWNPKRR